MAYKSAGDDIAILMNAADEARILASLFDERPKFWFDANRWFPCFKPDLGKIYGAFVAAHRTNPHAYHQDLLGLRCNRSMVSKFGYGTMKILTWSDFDSTNPVTFRQYLAENGFDVSVFG